MNAQRSARKYVKEASFIGQPLRSRAILFQVGVVQAVKADGPGRHIAENHLPMRTLIAEALTTAKQGRLAHDKASGYDRNETV
jgi:hypothetical protein